MTTVQFIAQLRSQGVKLWMNGSQLCYSAPAGVPLAPDFLAALKERKAEILNFLLEANQKIQLASSVIKPTTRERSGRMPLSYAQERLWFVNQLQPGSTSYNMPGAFRITGVLDMTALERAINEIIRRHETLRTIFELADAGPVQVIHEYQWQALAWVDLTGLQDGKRQQIARELIRQESEQTFDLSRGPLVRFRLLQSSPIDQTLLFTLHHIISDGWSMGVLARELGQLYDAFSSGLDSPLPALTIQYADYAAWQRDLYQGETWKKQLAYWREQLKAPPETLELAADRPRPAVPSGRGAATSLVLSKEISQGLNQFSQRHGVTLFMTLLAGWKVLLYRHTGQEDVVVGTPIANRNRKEIEGLIGFFVNTLVMRADLSGNPTFLDLLDRERKVALDAYEHQDIPFEQLVQELQPERDPGRNPLFQVFFNLVNLGEETLHLRGVQLLPQKRETVSAKFDLTLYVYEVGEQVTLEIVYNTDLFAEPRIRELLHQLGYLFEQIVDSPEKTIDAFSLVTPDCRAFLPDLRVPLPEPAQDLVVDSFLSWTNKTPNSIALCQGDRSWSYGQMHFCVRKITQTLRCAGFRRGDVVAVTGLRSFGLIASMLAVLDAGGVLLTLDDHLPINRRLLMLREGKAKGMLFVGSYRDAESHYEQLVSLKILCVEPDTGEVELGSPLEHRVLEDAEKTQLDDPAYLFFTSGTTGVPKAVLGTHKGLSHFLKWQRETFGVGPGDRSAQLTGFSFDVVLRDIFLSITSGATLCLPVVHHESGPEEVMSWMVEQRITLLHTVPTLAQFWLGGCSPGFTLPELRLVFFAGEPLNAILTERWREIISGHGQIVNLYGPTETTLAKCFYVVPPDPSPGVQPLGLPLPQTQVLVMGKTGQSCGIGEPGEIAIRTPFRSLGYTNAGEESRRRFLKNPSREDDRDLIYHTGDRGRYRSDGSLEILGRLDGQIKIRGIRIELSEIEAALLQHPTVKACAVIDRKEDQLVQLIAYIVTSRWDETIVPELMDYLHQHLPAALVPADFIRMDSLPLTANGKVDRKNLPKIERPAEPRNIATAPCNPTEELMHGIWSEVLKRDGIGTNENFFELGGHSLLAMQLISRVRRVFGVDMPLNDLFQGPTVAKLSKKVEELKQAESGLNAPPLVKVGRKEESLSTDAHLAEKVGDAGRNGLNPGPQIARIKEGDSLPLSYAQERLWWLYRLYPKFPFNMRLVLQIEGKLKLELLRQSFHAVLKRHEMFRTTFQVIEGLTRQVIVPNSGLDIPLVVLSDGPSAEREAMRLMEEDARQPFDLAEYPLFRVKVFRLGNDYHMFMLVMHHILADGWSLRVLLRELVELYHAFSNGQPSPLPELPIQYGDFAMWQRNWLQGKIWDSQLNYWKGKLAGDLPILELPTSRPRPAVPTRRGAIEKFIIDKRILDGLELLSQQNGVTLFMTLLAAFNSLLSRYSGQEDILTGTHLAGRNRTETEGLIGFFINRLLLRSDLSGNPTFEQLLRQTLEVTLQAFKNGDIPFEQVAAELKHDRNRNLTSLIQVMIVLENEPEKLPALSDLKVNVVEFDQPIGDVDIYLSMVKAPGGLQGRLQYNTDVFDRSRIVQITGHLAAILDSIIQNPRQRVSDLCLLSEPEHRQLLEWNDTRVDYRDDRCIHELFEGRAARTPDAVAVVYEQQELSYRMLNERSNQLAHYLRERGVGPEVLVGVCMERSLEMVVGLFGILKAGGAYVPLDPHYPKDRLAFMLKDARVDVVLTQKRFRERLDTVRETICLDDWPVGDRKNENPRNVVRGQSMAYMIYTSGSTGNPKGAINTHEGIRNRLQWMQAAYNLEAGDSVLQKTPYTFDVSVWEFFWPLLSGARLVMAQPEGHKDVPYLMQLMEREWITTVHFVPSMLRTFLEEVNPGKCSALKRVICSGETLPAELVRRFYERLPGQLHNLYGPTEAAVDVTYWACPRQMEGNTVPIGKPIANMDVHILDEHLNRVPVGARGTIYLGGVGLGRGYFGRAELTGERFIPHPFSTEPGQRLYWTGDWGRYLPDGNVEFLGRMDHQVKLRGFRIELGEIETMLGGHALVEQAVVMVRETEGEKRIVGYVVARSGASIEELRNYLKGKLPEYMVPAFIVMLDTFPLMPNGKIDRHRLPEPETITNKTVDFAAPETPIERELAAVWQRVLKVENIGIHQNFFDLGGHSLMATQIITQIRHIFHIELPLHTLFTGDFTIAGLARIIAERQLQLTDQTELASLLTQLEGLSDDEARELLSEESNG